MAFDDKFGYHELLHTAHIMVCTFNDFICDHGLMETNETLKKESDRILRELANFYQLVGREEFKKFGDE